MSTTPIVSEVRAGQIYATLKDSYELAPISLDKPEYALPSKSGNPLYDAVPKVSLEELVTGQVDGDGAFEKLMAAMKAELKGEFDKGRITGDQYTKAFIELTQLGMSTGLQYVMGREASFWQAMAAKEQSKRAEIEAVIAAVQLEAAKSAAALQRYQADAAQAQFALTKLQLASEDARYKLLQEQISQATVQTTLLENQVTMAQAQLVMLQRQTETQVAQTTMLQKQTIMVERQTENQVAQTETQNAQTLMLQKQTIMVQRQTETQIAQTAMLETQTTMVEKQIETQAKQTLMLQAQILMVGEQTQTQAAQTLMVQSQTAHQNAETVLIGRQSSHEVVKQAATQAQIDMLEKQRQLVQEQIEAAHAQVEDTQTDGSQVNGTIRRQRDLLEQQTEAFVRDSDARVGKMYLDAWITQKTVNEDLLAPDQLVNAEINEVLVAMRSRAGLA